MCIVAKMENVGRMFLGRYLINTSVAVCCNNNEIQKWAAGHTVVALANEFNLKKPMLTNRKHGHIICL